MLFRSWRRGFARDADRSGDPFTKVVSSLVFHQVPMEEKRRGIEAMARTVVPGGEVHVADYERPRSRQMRTLFGLVKRLDVAVNTAPHALGGRERKGGVGGKGVVEGIGDGGSGKNTQKKTS